MRTPLRVASGLLTLLLLAQPLGWAGCKEELERLRGTRAVSKLQSRVYEACRHYGVGEETSWYYVTQVPVGWEDRFIAIVRLHQGRPDVGLREVKFFHSQTGGAARLDKVLKYAVEKDVPYSQALLSIGP